MNTPNDQTGSAALIVATMLIVVPMQTACGNGSLDPNQSDETTQTDSGISSGQTNVESANLKVVRLGPDGPVTVHEGSISAQERQAMFQQRLAQKHIAQGATSSTTNAPEDRGIEAHQYLVTNGGCGDNAVWVFSGTNMTGDMVCLTRDPNMGWNDQANLANYPWLTLVQSLWAGEDPGHIVLQYPATDLYGTPKTMYFPIRFPAWTPMYTLPPSGGGVSSSPPGIALCGIGVDSDNAGATVTVGAELGCDPDGTCYTFQPGYSGWGNSGYSSLPSSGYYGTLDVATIFTNTKNTGFPYTHTFALKPGIEYQVGIGSVSVGTSCYVASTAIGFIVEYAPRSEGAAEQTVCSSSCVVGNYHGGYSTVCVCDPSCTYQNGQLVP